MAINARVAGSFSSSPASGFPVPAGSGVPLRNIVVCLDGSALSEEILPIAASWAAAAGMTLRLVHVTSPFMTGIGGRAELGLPSGESPERYLRHLLGRLDRPGLDVRSRVIYDPYIARAIAQYAERIPGCIVALTTHGLTGLRRLAMGSVAMKIVKECNCPVLVLRPRRLPLKPMRDETVEEASLLAAS